MKIDTMRAKITLTHKNEKLLDGCLMDFDGDKTNLRDLEKAVMAAKSECNTEANRNGIALKDCEMKIVFI